MKRQFVESLQEGDVVNDYFVAAHKDLRTQPNGSQFLGMAFKDRTGEIGGILWQSAVSVAAMFEVGDVVSVRGSVSSYQDRLQIRVQQVLPLKEGEYDLDDLVEKASNAEDAVAKLRALAETVQDPWLRALLDALWGDEAFAAAFGQAAAGKKWHHAARGGLARHCYEMARIAEVMAELFPELNRDLLLTAVTLHDVGKLEEMRHDIIVDYTTVGKLIGHVQLGAELVGKRIDGISGFPDPLRWQLLHCILSHHGELVNGAPVVPKTLEAVVLHHCDNLDAQADAITRVMAETREQRQEWSPYLPLIDRQIWARPDA